MSGARSDRPGLLKALRRIERGHSEGIVVAKLDRRSRSLTGALEIIKTLDETGAAFVSVAEGLDPTTAAGKMMVRLMLVMAEFELDRVRENWAESRRRAVARGVHVASKTPIGYQRGDGGRLKLDPDVAPHLAEAFRMRAASRPWAEILDFLIASGVRRAHGSPEWTSTLFTTLAKNRAYLGEARSGDHVNPEAHPALIDRGTWETVQVVRTLTATRAEAPALLAGIARCECCSNLLSANSGCLSSGEARRQYSCQRSRAKPPCPAPAGIRGWELEPHVEARFFELCGSLAAGGRRNIGPRRRAEAELLAAESRLSSRELGESEEELERARREVEAARLSLVQLTRLSHLPSLGELRRLWPDLEIPERRRHLALLIDTVVVRGNRREDIAERVVVMPFGAAPEVLPRGARAAGTPFQWPAANFAEVA